MKRNVFILGAIGFIGGLAAYYAIFVLYVKPLVLAGQSLREVWVTMGAWPKVPLSLLPPVIFAGFVLLVVGLFLPRNK
jgi:hypothetical protein